MTTDDVLALVASDAEAMLGPVFRVDGGPAVEPDMERMARALHRLCVRWGADSRSCTWGDLDDQGRGYWLMEAVILLTVATGKPAVD